MELIFRMVKNAKVKHFHFPFCKYFLLWECTSTLLILPQAAEGCSKNCLLLFNLKVHCHSQKTAIGLFLSSKPFQSSPHNEHLLFYISISEQTSFIFMSCYIRQSLFSYLWGKEHSINNFVSIKCKCSKSRNFWLDILWISFVYSE